MSQSGELHVDLARLPFQDHEDPEVGMRVDGNAAESAIDLELVLAGVSVGVVLIANLVVAVTVVDIDAAMVEVNVIKVEAPGAVVV